MSTPRRVLPPAYFFAYLAGASVLNGVLPIAQVIRPPGHHAGTVLIFAGSFLNFWAAELFQRNGTTIKPFETSTALVVEGPYKFSRNPMYLGLVLILLGAAILLGSLGAFLAPLAMFLTLQMRFIPAEEASMVSIFGDHYRQYQARVRRWI